MSMKIESDLRSFEKNNITERVSCKTQNAGIIFQCEFRFVFTVKLPATAEKKFTVASILPGFFIPFP